MLGGVDDIQSAENAWKVGREGGAARLACMTAISSARCRDGCDTRLDAAVDRIGSEGPA
ncbi:MAG: hypothetical protein ACLR4Z_06520 [Butyricicoccaceae bacterium]